MLRCAREMKLNARVSLRCVKDITVVALNDVKALTLAIESAPTSYAAIVIDFYLTVQVLSRRIMSLWLQREDWPQSMALS